MELTHWQYLSDHGLSRADLRAMLARGEIERVRRAVYAGSVPLSPPERHRRLVAATWPDLRPGAVVSHVSAAVLHGLPVPTSGLDRVWVTRAGSNGGKGPHGSLRLVRWELSADELVEIDGMLVTSLERTVCDVLRRVSLIDGVVLADAALRQDADRETALELLRREHRRHRTTTALSALTFADPRAESPGESRSRVLMHRHGIPRPDLQVEFFDRDGLIGRADFGWEEHALLGEFDGRVKYTANLAPGGDVAEAVWREKLREDRGRRSGRGFVRWTWSDFATETALVLRWRRALGLA